MVKGLLFDYGGTLDTNGRHWGAVIWEVYKQLQVPITKATFVKAYAYGERTLGRSNLIASQYSFLEVMKVKVSKQFEYLEREGHLLNPDHVSAIAAICEEAARSTVRLSERVLAALHDTYRMAIVSNFYGNLERVLTDFGIGHYFQATIESAVVGIRKPDAGIYQMGVKALGLSAGDCVVIGDSYSKDMIPAAIAGCRSVWLNVAGWEESGIDEYELVDVEIKAITELPGVLIGMEAQ